MTGNDFPGGSVSKESTCNARDTGDSGLIPRSGKSPGGGHGNPLQYSCLDNPIDRGAWKATWLGERTSQVIEKEVRFLPERDEFGGLQVPPSVGT